MRISLSDTELEHVLGDRPLLGAKPKSVKRWKLAPSFNRASAVATLQYGDLGRVAFTGGLLAAKDFRRDLYVHMGFHPAWKYERVIELLVDDGKVIARFDRSEAMAKMRERLATSDLGRPGPNATKSEIREWIEKTFRQDYKLGVGLDADDHPTPS